MLHRFLSAFGQDIRRAARVFSTSPGFAAIAILSLAIGIGANMSLFSVANALMLHPLPYKDPAPLVILWNRSPGPNITQDWFSTGQCLDIRNGHAGLEQVAFAFGNDLNMTGGGNPERIGATRVSSNFLPDEDSPGRPASAVLTRGMWVRRFGSDQGAIGESLTLNG